MTTTARKRSASSAAKSRQQSRASTSETADAGGPWADSLDDWKAARRIDITLPSFRRVTVQTVTLDDLIALDAIPDDLVRTAILVSADLLGVDIAKSLEKGDEDAAKRRSAEVVQVRDRLVLAAVVEPGLDEDDLAELDPYDKAMIMDIAQRRVVVDAVGRRVGADALETFRVFARRHECAEGCADCAAAWEEAFPGER